MRDFMSFSCAETVRCFYKVLKLLLCSHSKTQIENESKSNLANRSRENLSCFHMLLVADNLRNSYEVDSVLNSCHVHIEAIYNKIPFHSR